MNPMTTRPILIHPDPRLKTVADPVAAVDDDVRRLADDMLQTMYEAPGIGLAAPQVGVLTRMLVMDCANTSSGETPDPLCLINPKIVDATEETREYEEGCLSLPQVFAPVTRPASVRVRYQDAEGVDHERDFEGLWAICVQHEIDHLDGKLFVDYVSATKRAMITQKMKRLKRDIAKDPDNYPYSTAARLRRAAEQT